MSVRGRLAAILGIGLIVSPTVPAAEDLLYRERGDRHEGVKAKPVGGFDLELVSVLIESVGEPEPNVSGEDLPDEVALCFFLPATQGEVFVTVRESDYRTFYWMDQLRPAAGWTAGAWNPFRWSTKEVLKPLRSLGLPELAALVRLRDPHPGLVERVAPVILFYDRRPTAVAGYRFALRPAADSEIFATVTRVEDDQEVAELRSRRASGGRSITFRWRAGEALPGAYRIRFRGSFLNTGRRLDKTVFLHHEPAVGQGCG